jgi:hypothetical protein
LYPNRGQGYVVTINAGEASFNLVREIQYAIAGEFGWPETGRTKITTVAVDPAALELVTGTYVFDYAGGQRHMEPRVVREGTRLFFEGWLPAREQLHPQSPTTFIGENGTRLTYGVDSSGRGVLTMGEGPRALKGFKK